MSVDPRALLARRIAAGDHFTIEEARQVAQYALALELNAVTLRTDHARTEAALAFANLQRRENP